MVMVMAVVKSIEWFHEELATIKVFLLRFTKTELLPKEVPVSVLPLKLSSGPCLLHGQGKWLLYTPV